MNILIIFILVWILLGVIAFFLEKKDWNNGIAPSGLPWDHFDNDSQGGRGYTDHQGNYIWISWPWVEKNEH